MANSPFIEAFVFIDTLRKIELELFFWNFNGRILKSNLSWNPNFSESLPVYCKLIRDSIPTLSVST